MLPRCFLLGLLVLGTCGCGSSDSRAQDRPVNPSAGAASLATPFDHHLLVDQFGYRPGDPKVAVVRDPHVGYDSKDRFAPGAEYQVRRADDGAAVFSGKLSAWGGGAVEASSGDAGWWFDFSVVDAPGKYFVYDVARNRRSPTFRIDDRVYSDALRAAVRMYFYQRSGYGKHQPQAQSCWTDEPAYLRPDQDVGARDVTDRANSAKVRNLSGGWFDAGDTNKYVTFAAQPVHQLLTAYQENSQAFTDDFGIPESGNGIPDLLDEVKWETDWLKRMQFDDGSAALKVGSIVYAAASPPSTDKSARFYVPSCTSSTIALAGMLAHASFVFARFPALEAEAADLRRRAAAAWRNYRSAPAKQTACDSQVVHAGKADWSAEDQDGEAVVAAVYLFAITGDSAYDDFIKANYKATRPYRDFGWTRYNPEQGEALLFYTGLAGADRALQATLIEDKRRDVAAGNHVYGFDARDDLYRSFMHEPQYHWGSNNPRAAYGNSNMDAIRYGAAAAEPPRLRDRALEILHYFHGVNPFGKVYLTNMYAYGATDSVNELFHVWFWPGSKWSDALTSACGPAPGYVPGGPVANAGAAGVPASMAPPSGQPAQKSYRDWNGNAPENSYVVNEPGIYYQSGYVKLLSNFVR